MNQGYIFAQCWVSFVFVLVIYCLVIRRQRAEWCRSQIRFIRDELFDFMRDQDFSFDSPAYRETRNIMNGLMRLTNTIGPFQFIAMILCFHDEDGDQKTKREIDKLEDGPLKEKLSKASKRATNVFVEFLFLTGVSGICVRCLMFVFRALHFAVKVRRWVSCRVDVLTDVANDFGNHTLTPRQQSLLR